MDARLLLRRAVEARIEAWDHPVIEERDESAAEVGLMLQEVVRQELSDAVPPYASLDGVRELSAEVEGDKQLYVLGAFYLLSGNRDAMLPLEADLNATPGSASTIRVGGKASIFDMPTSERQFVRRMETLAWTHRLTLHLPRRIGLFLRGTSGSALDRFAEADVLPQSGPCSGAAAWYERDK